MLKIDEPWNEDQPQYSGNKGFSKNRLAKKIYDKHDDITTANLEYGNKFCEQIYNTLLKRNDLKVKRIGIEYIENEKIDDEEINNFLKLLYEQSLLPHAPDMFIKNIVRIYNYLLDAKSEFACSVKSYDFYAQIKKIAGLDVYIATKEKDDVVFCKDTFKYCEIDDLIITGQGLTIKKEPLYYFDKTTFELFDLKHFTLTQ